MAFSLPSDLATNWQDNVGMIENAAYLNAVGTMNNQIKAALLGTVNNTSQAIVATSETTSSLTFTDLTTTTDTVTVTIGPSGMAMVILYAYMSVNSGICYVGYSASGANTISTSDNKGINFAQQYGMAYGAYGVTIMETGLNSGSTTFKMKYHVTNASYAGTFANRRITVIPFF